MAPRKNSAGRRAFLFELRVAAVYSGGMGNTTRIRSTLGISVLILSAFTSEFVNAGGYLNDSVTTRKLGGVGNYLFRDSSAGPVREIEEASANFVEIMSFSQSIPEHAEDPENLDTILFGDGSSAISAAELRKIESIAEKLEADPYLKAEVTGFADSIGKESSDESLPSARAKAVTEALREKGVSPARMFWTGARGTEIGTNRRVEIRYR
jgi:outer membrane protein OmpA-like peptidoglycan-associated protein